MLQSDAIQTSDEFYAQLAQQLWTGETTLESLRAASESFALRALTPPEFSALIHRARRQLYVAPRRAFAIAQVAALAAAHSADKAAPGYAELGLGEAELALGSFRQALASLERAHAGLLENDHSADAAQCLLLSAVAWSWLAQFDQAQDALDAARALAAPVNDIAFTPEYLRALGQLRRVQGNYAEALGAFARAWQALHGAERWDEAVLICCDLAATTRLTDLQDSQVWLARAREAAKRTASALLYSYCEYAEALVVQGLNQNRAALELYLRARQCFAAEGVDYMRALCEEGIGLAHFWLNDYAASLAHLETGRAFFQAAGMRGFVENADQNRAVVLYGMNRYAEALALYERLAALAQAQHPARAARCYTNMGLCYERLGRYDQAMVVHTRAYETLLPLSPLMAAHAQENLATTLGRVGRFPEARTHYRAARDVFVHSGAYLHAVYCDVQLASIHLAQRQYAEALTCLEQSLAVCQAQGLSSDVAKIQREAARVWLRRDAPARALELLQGASAHFAAKEMPYDLALCQLAMGEAALALQEYDQARQWFDAARAVLSPLFPDEAWRAHFGLGQRARIMQDLNGALAHWLEAVRCLSQTRDALQSERLSGSFFELHRAIYDETVWLALESGETEIALRVGEASKARTLAFWLLNSPLQAPDAADPHRAALVQREQEQRRALESLRQALHRVELDDPFHASPPDRSVPTQFEQLHVLHELEAQYEQTVEQLRLLDPRLRHASTPRALSLDTIRAGLPRCGIGTWTSLSYYFKAKELVILESDAARARTHRRVLDAYAEMGLHQCASPHLDYREMIYNGTLHGFATPGSLRHAFFKQLGQLLIPPTPRPPELIIISPHGELHTLPFATLRVDNEPLVRQTACLHVPSLYALEALLRQPRRRAVQSRVLFCGLSDFQDNAPALPAAASELAVLSRTFGNRLDVLWGREATRQTLLEWSASQRLAEYEFIHFASHTLLDAQAPSQSGILLADERLTFTDILQLRVSARLIVLSTCESALGASFPGDEMMSLARAFFCSGAQSIVASLWRVRDDAAEVFFARFYRALQRGTSIPQTVRAAQLEMLEEGRSAYDWAPFIAIGLP